MTDFKQRVSDVMIEFCRFLTSHNNILCEFILSLLFIMLYLVSWPFWGSFFCFYRNFWHMEQKMATKHITDHIYHNQNTWEMDHFYVLLMNELCVYVSCQFVDSYCGFYRHFCRLKPKMATKTHNRPYVPFLITKIPGRWIIFDVLLLNEFCV
jgi:hypothetical protein